MNNRAIAIEKVSAPQLKPLQQIGKQTFKESFAHQNTVEDMEKYLTENFSTEKLTKELTDPNSEFYFARLDDQIIGYLKINMGQAQTEIDNNLSLEIERIYVLKGYQGKKVGQMLFEKALQIARLKKFDYVWLGVWEKNPRAIRFYEKNGFVQFDKHTFMLGNDQQTDIMMKLVLR